VTAPRSSRSAWQRRQACGSVWRRLLAGDIAGWLGITRFDSLVARRLRGEPQ
jgi:hypothetical protein